MIKLSKKYTKTSPPRDGRGYYGGLFDNLVQVNNRLKIQYGGYLGTITINRCPTKLANILKLITHHIYFLKNVPKYPHLGVEGGINVGFSIIWFKQPTDEIPIWSLFRD